jgi:Na+/H+ antiporter NhaC
MKRGNGSVKTKEDGEKKYKIEFYGGRIMGIIPIAIYIVVSVGLAVFFQVYSMKGLVFASIIGLLFAFFFVKNKSKYWKSVIGGLAQFGNSKLIFTFIMIGIFTKLLTVGNIGSGFVWLSTKLSITGSAFVVFTFIASTIISMGTGAPIAAVFAVVPIFYPPGIMLGAKASVLVGAILSGVFFGDAMSPSSQVINTTIDTQHDAATQQSAKLQTVMKERTPYLLAIAVISAIMFYLFGADGAQVSAQQLAQVAADSDGTGLIMLIPIAVLLVISFIKQDLFLGLSYATVLGLILGVVFGNFTLREIFMITPKLELTGILMDGMYSMTDIIISSILLFGMIAIAVDSGCLDLLCDWILSKKAIQTKAGAEMVLVLSIALINILLSGCVLPAILLFGGVADKIGQSVNISANKRSYLLTGMATTFTAIVPINSAFVMGSMTLINQIEVSGVKNISINPFEIFVSSYYCLLLTVVCFVWVLQDKKSSRKANFEEVGV